MKYQPPKIVHLTVLGFFVVLLPIVAAVIRGAGALDQLSRKHRDDMATVVSITEKSELLRKELSDLERVARQFEVLQDEALLDILKKRYFEFLTLLDELSTLSVGILGVQPIADDIKKQARRVFETYQLEQISKETPSRGMLKAANNDVSKSRLAVFEKLHVLQEKLDGILSSDLDTRVQQAKSSAEKIRTELVVLGFALLPLTILLIAFFTAIITRPIKQIRRAIVSLGEGRYKDRFEVQGPGDLQQLAAQLAWLSRKLRVADEEKKRFLRHVSHELKTPLASIKEGVELLRDEIPGPLNKNQKDVVSILHNGVESFRSLINNLLDYNLLKRDPDTHAAWIKLDTVVREVIEPHRLTAERKEITLSAEGESLELLIDRSLLRAALDNLISNGVHYTPEGGDVTLRWDYRQQEKQLVISISDTGPGIPKEEREQVFLPFYQGKTLKKGPLKGTGLGLSIARECVESLQGTIRILDSSIGTFFELKLPVAVKKDGV